MLFFDRKNKMAKNQQVVLLLSGLHCVSCALSIDETVEELPGVKRSQTEYARQRTKVEFDPEKIQPSAFIAAIEELGYQAKMESEA